MKENIREQPSAEGVKTLRITTAMLCAFLLLAAYLLEASFYPQLIIYIFLLLNLRSILIAGFDALSSFAPNSRSLAAVSAFAALLHGVSTLDEKNCFFYAAITLALTEYSDFLAEKHFEPSADHRCFADSLSAAVVPISLVIMIVTVIINLMLGKDLFDVITHAFTTLVFICPCILAFSGTLIAVISARAASEYGIKFRLPQVPERLGKVKELIIEQRGIVTENDYSVYDVYSTDGDKIKLLAVAAAAESHFTHPFADAIISAARSIDAPRLTAENCFEICSRGVCATVKHDKYFLGNKKLLRDKRIRIPDAVSSIDYGFYTPLYVAKNGEFLGMILLYSKISFGTAETLEQIKNMGIRRILLSDAEREDLKYYFDILLTEREKVLQEFKKGAKIKAMTVTECPVAKADVVAVTSSGSTADIDLPGNTLPCVLYSLIIGRKAFACVRLVMGMSMLAAITFAVFAALDVAFLPLTAAFVTSLPLIFCLGILRIPLPGFTSSEEDKMFGKVNYTMKIEGMSCTHCSARVKTALETLRGVSAKISLEEKTAHIKCPASTTAEALAKAVTDVGFTVVSTERV